MSAFSIVFVACIVLLGFEGLKLPDYITPCSRTDPNLNQCALEHGRETIPKILKGDRKYGVPNLDPLFVKEVHLNEFGFSINVTNLTVEGMKDADLQDIRVDFDKLIISFQLNLPLLVFRGKYEMSGSLLNLPITGKGDLNASMVDVAVKYKTFCNLTTNSDGQTYLQPVDYELVMEPKSGSFYFGNLFNGNKLLGDTMNNYLTENFLLVFEEVGQPVFRTLGLIVHQLMKGFMEKVPYDELYPKDN